jgi:hypothetical protein
MPRLSAWFVRASLIYLSLGFTFGALMLANDGLAFAPQLGRLLPAHMEFLFMGWFMQLAMGVAYWILPRFTSGLPRGNETITWLSLILLNAGILMVALSTLFEVAWLALAGRFCEAASVLAFLLIAWRRVRPSK